ncbi:MAG: hypothetical protein H6Q93_311 [Nitrospirae bacterium]|nr:hypothetical protein [Nitrospirota bacterium]
METKKFLFTLSHSSSNPVEVVVYMKIASNIKAFDDSAEVVFFLVGEGVELAKKGVAETMSLELEGKQVGGACEEGSGRNHVPGAGGQTGKRWRVARIAW